jgi:TMEM175 potassium channel family protein
VNPTGRLASFSDNVFAFAATLLVFSVGTPHPKPNESLITAAFEQQWPSLLAMALGFLTIGTAWIAHRNAVRGLEVETHTVVLVNLAILFLVAIVPFTTELVSDYLRNSSREEDASFLFGAAFALLLSFIVLLDLLGRPEAKRPHGARAWISPQPLGPLVYAGGAVLSLFLPYVGLVIYLVASLWLLIVPNSLMAIGRTGD